MRHESDIARRQRQAVESVFFALEIMLIFSDFHFHLPLEDGELVRPVLEGTGRLSLM